MSKKEEYVFLCGFSENYARGEDRKLSVRIAQYAKFGYVVTDTGILGEKFDEPFYAVMVKISA